MKKYIKFNNLIALWKFEYVKLRIYRLNKFNFKNNMDSTNSPATGPGVGPGRKIIK